MVQATTYDAPPAPGPNNNNTNPTTTNSNNGKPISRDVLSGELRTLLERFANGMSLDVIGDAMRALYNDAQQDEELRDWFRQCDQYARRVSAS